MAKYSEALKNAYKAKNNKIYTRIEDIDKALSLYIEELCDKIVYCNCDNTYKSIFAKYLPDNFNKLNLKKTNSGILQ